MDQSHSTIEMDSEPEGTETGILKQRLSMIEVDANHAMATTRRNHAYHKASSKAHTRISASAPTSAYPGPASDYPRSTFLAFNSGLPFHTLSASNAYSSATSPLYSHATSGVFPPTLCVADTSTSKLPVVHDTNAIQPEVPLGSVAIGTTTASTPTRLSSIASTDSTDSTGSTGSSGSTSSTTPSYLRGLITPVKPVGAAPPLWQGLKAIALMSWLNVLLVFIPVSWACHFAMPKSDQNDTLIFAFSFLAIIPLGKMLVFATNELSMRVGQTLAGLITATLGNAIELIVATIALVRCQLQVVQASLVGSILSNLLLVFGLCCLAGGTGFSDQRSDTNSEIYEYFTKVARPNSSLLTVSVIAVLLPAAFHTAVGDQIPHPQEAKDILAVSHGAAIILLCIYLVYLAFRVFSLGELCQRSGRERTEGRTPLETELYMSTTPSPDSLVAMGSSPEIQLDTMTRERTWSHSYNPSTLEDLEQHGNEPEEKKIRTPQMGIPLTIALIIVVTVVVAVITVWLVDSIDGLTSSWNTSKQFVGLILPLIAGNAAEHITVVKESLDKNLTLSLSFAIGSSILALFVIPLLVTMGWMIGKPLSLLFDPFESIVLFLSVLVVNYVMQHGKIDWLEGMILVCLYVIIAITFWYYPGVNELPSLLSC